jgi:NADH-quinone oxidoreductase subunit C
VPTNPAILAAIQDRFPAAAASEFRGDTRVAVPTGDFFDLMQFLREQQGFDYLVDVTCVDYLHYRDATHRFGLVYLLTNVAANERLTVRTYVDEPNPTVRSVVPLWEGANWFEREVYDMFGIDFAGHPDLRRILMPPEFTAFPLRKDYPLQGRGERHNFTPLRRGEG